MSDTTQNIRVVPDTLNGLVYGVGKGEYRIPQFQREYVWEKTKVIRLFDSIYHEYPIGSFFLWKAGREYNNLFRFSLRQFANPDRHDPDLAPNATSGWGVTTGMTTDRGFYDKLRDLRG